MAATFVSAVALGTADPVHAGEGPEPGAWPGAQPSEASAGTRREAPAASTLRSPTLVDTPLRAMLSSALDSHPAVRAGRMRADAGRLDVRAAERQRWPSPSLAVNAGDGPTATEFRLTQPLWDWGRTNARVDAAQARADASAADVDAVRQSVAMEIVEAWRAWAGGRAREQALAADLSRLAQYARRAQARQVVGYGAEADASMVVMRLAQSRAEQSTAQATQASALARLRSLGVATPTWIPPASTSAGASPSPGDDVLVDGAVESSATLERLRRDAEAAQAEVDQLAAQRWPTVNAVYVRQHTTGGATTASSDSRVMLTLEYVPGAWQAAADAVRAARGRLAAAQVDMETARSDIGKQVRAEIEVGRGLAARIPSETLAASTSTAVLESFERQFDAGRKSWLDVLNAARDLTAAEVASASTRIEWLASRARLAVLVDGAASDGSAR